MLKDKTFQDCYRSKSRKLLVKDLEGVIKKHRGSTTPKDQVYCLNLCKHKIIENFEKEKQHGK